MPTVKPTITVEVKLGASWVDVTADTQSVVQPLDISYGISGAGPNDRIASTGTAQFALNNSSSNSTGDTGAYSPGHDDARTGWDIGVLCRISLTYGGTTYWKHVGTVTSIVPDAGLYKRKSVQVTSVDWMDEAATSKVSGVEIETGKRADELVAELVTTAVTRQPQQTSYATGISTFAYAFDNLKDTQTSVIQALSGASPSATFDDTMVGLDVSRARADLINTIYIVVHPRTVSAATTNVLWELTTTEVQPSIPAGGTDLRVFLR